MQPCVDAYYGIGEAVDYSKAYACFQEHEVQQFIILMLLNGEGTAKDPKQAAEDLHAWSLDHNDEGENGNLKKEVESHVGNPQAPRVDFCKDIAYSMYSIGFCSGIENALAQQESDLMMKKIRGSLQPAQQVEWDKVQEAFSRYQRDEGSRIEKQFEQGTIRGVAYDSHLEYVRSNFQKLVVMAFLKKGLSPAEAGESKTLLSRVQTAYQADIDDYVKSMSNMDGPNSPDEAKDIAEYKEIAETSQKAWEAVRDLCSALAADVYKQNGVDGSTSMSVAMSKLRIDEIRDNPVGGS